MQQFIVGGAIRDLLLNRVPKDFDFVWVGATPEEMIKMGMSQVGSDFPVFLDKSGNEHALARKERKVGKGYCGFDCQYDIGVTLEDDLFRRDLTINAMAREVIGWRGGEPILGNLIDPFNGQQDLKDGVLRNVSEHFREDPVRVLRTARFAARYGFDVADCTRELMRDMVSVGEVDHLVPERVWSEMERAMLEQHPFRFFGELKKVGALKILMPELDHVVDLCEKALKHPPASVEVGFAILLLHNQLDEVESMLEALKVPNKVWQMATRMNKIFPMLNSWNGRDATEALKMCEILRYHDEHHLTAVFGAFQDEGLLSLAIKLESANAQARDTHFIHLSQEQQDTLKGKEIGIAINNARVARINAVLAGGHALSS